MSMTIDEFLEHHGVKGMKWGVHRADVIISDSQRKIAAAATKELNKTGVKQLNAKAMYKDMDLTKNKALARAYQRDAEDLFDQTYNKYVTKAQRRDEMKYRVKTGVVLGAAVATVRVAIYTGVLAVHADDNQDFTVSYDLTLNSLGQIESVKESGIQHVENMTIDKFIAHFGIKGMKWGVRRERGPSGTVKSGLSSSPKKLSDADLHAAVQRMRLEREFSQLSAQRVSKGEGFIKSTLKDIGKKQVRRVANSAADLAVEQALKNIGAKSNNPHLGEIAKRIGPKKKK